MSATKPLRRTMPPYRAVLVVDAVRFSAAASAQQPGLSAQIIEVLELSFARAGLADAWNDRRFKQQAHTGDGCTVGLHPRTLPLLLHPFLAELQAELEGRDALRLASEPRLRLRASVHVGPLPDEGGWTDGVGRPMVDTHRLLDSTEVRAALSDADEAVTFVAAIVSERVFDEVVLGGFCELHPSQFTPVVATAKAGFAQRGYLHVPKPTPRRPEERREEDRARGVLGSGGASAKSVIDQRQQAVRYQTIMTGDVQQVRLQFSADPARPPVVGRTEVQDSSGSTDM